MLYAERFSNQNKKLTLDVGAEVGALVVGDCVG